MRLKQEIIRLTAILIMANTAVFAKNESAHEQVQVPQCLAAKIRVSHQVLAENKQFKIIDLLSSDINNLTQLADQVQCGRFVNVSHQLSGTAWVDKQHGAQILLQNSMLRSPRSTQFNRDSYEIKHQEEVKAALKKVVAANIWETLTHLTYFYDRSARTDSGVHTAYWLKNIFEDMAYEYGRNDTATFFVETGQYKQPSLVTVIGKGLDEDAVVLGAHMDTLDSLDDHIAGSHPMPGAGDDGSGSASLMEMTRILLSSKTTFKHPIYIIWYAAEERGLVGSQHVVQHFKTEKILVKAAIQFDMTGYRVNPDDPTMWVFTDMEKWFSLQLFTVKKDQVEKNQSGYTTLLGSWLDDNGKNEWQAKLTNLRFTLHGAKAFSLLAAAFMGLGTTYLIVDAFTVIPFFAAIPFVSWPIIILPMAIIAGAAYGMMTYNALTDLINNKTLCKWHKKLQDDYTNDGLSVRNVFMATITVLLVGLALALTMCTAGTWWTVASNTRPLFEWMKKMPTFVMSIINPVIIAFSALFFNIQNTAQSLEMVDEATRIKENPLKQFKNAIVNGYKNLCDNENLLQRINIPRILLKLTITPLRILLFLGHLISIAVTADRMPGIPQIVAALVAFISEGFEDAHYFVGHNHAHHHDEHLHDEHHHDDHHQCSQPINTKALLKERLGSTHTHNHNLDIPTLCLKVVASPLYLAAALWDFVFSQRNSTKRNSTKRVLTFWEAWSKQIGEETEHEVILEPHAERPSQQWKIEHTVFLIEKYKTKHLKEVTVGCNLAADKMSELNQLQQTVNNGGNLAVEFETAKNKEVFKRHRFPLFFQTDERTTTQLFIEELPGRIIA